MKKLVFYIITIAFLSFLFHLNFSDLPKFERSETILLPPLDTVDIEEGKKLALTICYSCHYNKETETLAGRIHGNPKKLGNFYSGNITQDKDFGIGAWTNEELYYFLRTGVNRDGEYVFDMPKYPNLTEADLLSLIAFLRSNHKLVKATAFENPPPEYSLLMKGALLYWLRPIDIELINQNKTGVNKENQVEFGRYLSTAKYSCFDCHSRNAITNNYLYPEKSLGFFEGDNPHVNEMGERIDAPALIGISEKYSSAEFVKAVKLGITPFSTTLKDPMLPFVYLSDYEIESIYLYLNSLEE